MRGGEKVLLSLARLFPDAPIFTLLHVRGLAWRPSWRRATSAPPSSSACPAVERRYRQYLPALPRRRRLHRPLRLRPRHLQLALRGQGRAAPRRARCTSATATRRCATCGTATTTTSAPDRLSGAGRGRSSPVVAEALRAWDVATAARVHRFAANSAYVAGRIRRYYGRAAAVIPPPVDTDFFTPGDDAPGRLRPRGLRPRALQAASSWCSRRTAARAAPLKIVGGGPGGGRGCARWRGREVEFLGRVDDADAARPVPRLPRGDHAQRRGLRDRAPRGHGLRAAGGRLRARAAGAESVLARARRASSSTSPRRPRCGPPLTRWRACVLIPPRSGPAPRPTAARCSRLASGPSWRTPWRTGSLPRQSPAW